MGMEFAGNMGRPMRRSISKWFFIVLTPVLVGGCFLGPQPEPPDMNEAGARDDGDWGVGDAGTDGAWDCNSGIAGETNDGFCDEDPEGDAVPVEPSDRFQDRGAYEPVDSFDGRVYLPIDLEDVASDDEMPEPTFDDDEARGGLVVLIEEEDDEGSDDDDSDAAFDLGL